jgi:FkbM family methyltransferase
MGLGQFAKSLKRIVANPHINMGSGIARHLNWQYLKVRDRFPRELRISRSRIVAAHRRCGVSALIYSQDLYDYNNMKLLQAVLADGGVFWDIGANIGAYTLVGSEQDKAHIVAFEPHPATFHLLRNNVTLNGRPNISILNFALGRVDASVFLTDEAGSATNHFESGPAARTVAVRCMRADTACRQQGTTPRIVKIDVEGFEYDVLVGFGRCLESVDVVMIELNGLSDQRSRGRAEIHRLLVSTGFTGPWRCDFDRRTLTPEDGSGCEDSLYLSDRGVRGLELQNFWIAGAQ